MVNLSGTPHRSKLTDAMFEMLLMLKVKCRVIVVAKFQKSASEICIMTISSIADIVGAVGLSVSRQSSVIILLFVN